MKNLKLNQLNRQKMSEREMNVVAGGAAPVSDGKFEFVYNKCGEQCLGPSYPADFEGFVHATSAFR